MSNQDKAIIAAVLLFGVYLPLIYQFTDAMLYALAFYGGWVIGGDIGAVIARGYRE